jgi:hypothetical protein
MIEFIVSQICIKRDNGPIEAATSLQIRQGWKPVVLAACLRQPIMKGTFELKTPQDLLEKLRFDLSQLTNDPTNTYLAFNFFVTALHMTDWLYPGNSNRTRRDDLENSSILLQVPSHVTVIPSNSVFYVQRMARLYFVA